MRASRPPSSAAGPRPSERVYVLAAFVLAALVTVRALDVAFERGGPAPRPAAESVGRPRDVDPGRIEELIRRGELSDHPALFARPVEGPPPDR